MKWLPLISILVNAVIEYFRIRQTKQNIELGERRARNRQEKENEQVLDALDSAESDVASGAVSDDEIISR